MFPYTQPVLRKRVPRAAPERPRPLPESVAPTNTDGAATPGCDRAGPGLSRAAAPSARQSPRSRGRSPQPRSPAAARPGTSFPISTFPGKRQVLLRPPLVPSPAGRPAPWLRRLRPSRRPVAAAGPSLGRVHFVIRH